MGAHGVREFPPDVVRGRFVRRALQAAVTDVILPAFAAQAAELAAVGWPPTRDLAARASVYLQARTHYGIVDPAVLDGLRELWQAVLGDDGLEALDDLYARLLWIPDGELDRLDDAAREYRRIVGEPDPPASTGGSGDRAESGEAGEGSPHAETSAQTAKAGAGAGSLADALAQAIATASDQQLEQLEEDIDLQQLLGDAAARGPQAGKLGRGGGDGMPTGRMPDRGVDRPPYPDEVQQARRYANRLRQPITQGTRPIDKRTPAGGSTPRLRPRPAGHQPSLAGRPAPCGRPI
jgi:hypothetical protein